MDMITHAKFTIIGRIGNIHPRDNVTYISVASDRQAKVGDNWTTETDWNTVTILNQSLRKRFSNPKVGKAGNLVIFEGNIQTRSYDKDGATVYQTSLIVQDFDILSFARDGE
jgi:single-stranded DNA-binding protein